jgi:hypothetical protein
MGISQPQIHNVLKGTRKLQPQFADRIMDKFGISVLDLLEDGEVSSEALSRQDPGRRERLELSDVDHSVDVLRSAKGADAIRQAAKELASPSGGAVDSAPVLRAFLNRPVTRILAAPSLRKKAS